MRSWVVINVKLKFIQIKLPQFKSNHLIDHYYIFGWKRSGFMLIWFTMRFIGFNIFSKELLIFSDEIILLTIYFVHESEQLFKKFLFRDSDWKYFWKLFYAHEINVKPIETRSTMEKYKISVHLFRYFLVPCAFFLCCWYNSASLLCLL